VTPRHFLVTNFADAEKRLRRITAPVNTPDNESAVWQTLEDSAIGRVLSTAARWLNQARPHSRSREVLSARRAMWSAHGALGRMRMVGIALLTAVGVHVAMTATASPVGGWWLILPGIVAFFGAAAVALSFMGPATEGRN